MNDKINFAVIGLGLRGYSLLDRLLLTMDELTLVGVCDVYEDRVQRAKTCVLKKTGKSPIGEVDYKKVFEIENLDAVLISTSWEYHIEIALYAMKKGVAVAMEVGCVYSEKELWDLIDVHKSTGTPFMFMENCCFNKSEAMATAMARSGLFGKIVYAEAIYGHDLRSEIAGGLQNRHYRLRNYQRRNCDNYPTHGIGPIAKLLNINRGNRFISLISVASACEGMKEYIKQNADSYPELSGADFHQADIVTTVIKCANGETVLLRLDTTLPRFYARNFTVRGTKGFYEQNTNTVFIDGDNGKENYNTVENYTKYFNNAVDYEREYLPDLWKNLTDTQLKSGHGGMDYLTIKAFIDSLKRGEEMKIDVYDAATWMAVSYLSEMSIACGSKPVAFPDFTCGKWLVRERKNAF